MTTLFPNLDDLLAALPATAVGRDAAELATSAGESSTLADVDDALDRVVSRWAST